MENFQDYLHHILTLSHLNHDHLLVFSLDKKSVLQKKCQTPAINFMTGA